MHIFCGSNHKNVFYVSVLFYCDCHVAWLLNNSLQLFFLNKWKRASASNMSKVQWKPFVQMNYLRLRGSMMLHWLTLSVPLNNQRRNRKRLRSQTRLSFAHSFNKFQIDTEGNAISKQLQKPPSIKEIIVTLQRSNLGSESNIYACFRLRRCFPMEVDLLFFQMARGRSFQLMVRQSKSCFSMEMWNIQCLIKEWWGIDSEIMNVFLWHLHWSIASSVMNRLFMLKHVALF